MTDLIRGPLYSHAGCCLEHVQFEVLVSAICKDVGTPPQLQGGSVHCPGVSGIIGLCVGK